MNGASSEPGEARERSRERLRSLAAAARTQGKGLAWFDTVYREAAGDPTSVPWADLAPEASLVAWLAGAPARPGARAAVVGCGLGHDAVAVAAAGYDTTAFDVSPVAVEWARRLHPASGVRFETADLFEVPEAWRGAFDVVVEIHTLQALPARVRSTAAHAVVSLLAPGGRLFVRARVRDDAPGAPPLDEDAVGPPWPLGRAELLRLLAPLEPAHPLVETRDADDPSVLRAVGTFVRR